MSKYKSNLDRHLAYLDIDEDSDNDDLNNIAEAMWDIGYDRATIRKRFKEEGHNYDLLDGTTSEIKKEDDE